MNLLTTEELHSIPNDVIQHHILPVVDLSPLQLYNNRRISRYMYTRYIRLSPQQIGELALHKEAWITCIKEDDEFLFSRLLHVLKNRYIREEVFVDYVYNGTTDQEEPYYKEKVYTSRDDLNSRIIDESDIIRLVIDNNSEHIFSLLLKNDVFRDIILFSIMKDPDIINDYIILSWMNRDTLSDISGIIIDNYQYLLYMLEIIIKEGGSDGVRNLLDGWMKQELYLSYDYFAKYIIDSIEEYGLCDTEMDQIADYLNEYPYYYEVEE